MLAQELPVSEAVAIELVRFRRIVIIFSLDRVGSPPALSVTPAPSQPLMGVSLHYYAILTTQQEKDMDLQKPFPRTNFNILDMPNELLLDLGRYLSIMDLASARKTCHHLSRLLTQSHYKLGLKQDFGELTALQWAAARGHATLAEQAIFSGAKIDKPNKKRSGRTSLHLAAESNHLDVIRILLTHGARLSAKDSARKTPVHYTTMCEGAEGTMVLLEQGVDMMCQDKFGDSPAFLAARKGGIACMEALIAAGFDLNTRGRNGQTIRYAAVFGRRTMLRYLLEQKEMKMAVNVADAKGATPLHSVRDG